MSKITAVFLAFVFLISPLAARAEITLQPHKALYDITLKKVKSANQLTDVNGKMYYELARECDGWATDHRFSINYGFDQGGSIRMDSSFASWEAVDGTRFSFSSLQKNNGIKDKEVRGTAERSNKYSVGQIAYDVPRDRAGVLDSDVYFPSAHTIAVLEKAASGEKNFHASIFDGGDDKGPREVTGFVIGEAEPLPPEALNDQIDKSLLTRAWKIRMAFYAANGKNPDPEYEMTVVFHDNGIVSYMTVEYPDFTVEHKLTALEAVPDRPCE